MEDDLNKCSDMRKNIIHKVKKVVSLLDSAFFQFKYIDIITV